MNRNPYGSMSLIKLYYLPVTEFSFFLGGGRVGWGYYLFHRFMVFREIYENTISDIKELLKLSNFR